MGWLTIALAVRHGHRSFSALDTSGRHCSLTGGQEYSNGNYRAAHYSYAESSRSTRCQSRTDEATASDAL